MQRANASYIFGRFRLDAAERRLTRDGQVIPLTPKAFDTLLALVQHSGHALTKDELMRAVWPDGFVEEVNLAYNISILRKALADGQPGEKYIETVPKLGYRFVAPVSESSRVPEAHERKRTNLPTQLTRFIGRERDLADMAQTMTTQRLVTLVGAAGMGKTRLALEVGGGLREHFPDGVWLVELAPLMDSALVTQSVAARFGLQDQPNRTALDALTCFLEERHALVILDNCEHVVEACARLAETLLRACPRLHILATSREALTMLGEMIWRVQPLDTPDPAHMPELERVVQFESVQLFVEHAKLAQPGFALTRDNVGAVAHICHQLDGMPLAIEMAAAQVPDIGLKSIADGLSRRMLFSMTGSRTAAPHQQTLRATLDWSHTLLTEAEQVLLARLSVFAGGWTAEAAQAICGDDASAALSQLTQLVRKSLVAVFTAEDQRRYRLLQSVRQYADEKLHALGEYDLTRDRHLDYFLRLAEDHVDFMGPRVDLWVRRMDAEFDNIRTAFAWAMTRDDKGEQAMRLSYAMTVYLYNHGRLVEIGGWVDQANMRGSNTPAYARARALSAKAGVMILQGKHTQAMKCAEEAMLLFRQTDDRLGLAWSLEVLANNLFNECAQAYAEEALPLFRRLGSKDGEGRALRALGTAALRAGDRVQAAQLLEQSMETAPWDAVTCIPHLYGATPKRALELCAREQDRLIQSGNLERIAFIMDAHATLLMTEGNYVQAKRLLEESIRAWQQLGLIMPAAPGLFSAPLPVDIGELALPAWVTAIAHFSCTFASLAFAEILLGNTDCAHLRLSQLRKFAHHAGVTFVEVLADFLTNALMLATRRTDDDVRQAFAVLRHADQVDYRSGMLCSLVQVAELISCRSDHSTATKLLGAVATYLDQDKTFEHGYDRIPPIWLCRAQGAIITPTLAAARAALGEAAFEAAYAEGQAMMLEQAVALALKDA